MEYQYERKEEPSEDLLLRSQMNPIEKLGKTTQGIQVNNQKEFLSKIDNLRRTFKPRKRNPRSRKSPKIWRKNKRSNKIH